TSCGVALKGTTSPAIRRASSADMDNVDKQRLISPSQSALGKPVSEIMVSTKIALRCSISAAVLFNIRYLSSGDNDDAAENVRDAAFTACSTCTTEATAIWPYGL